MAVRRICGGLGGKLVMGQVEFGFPLPSPDSVGSADKLLQWQAEPGVYEKLTALLWNNNVILLA